MSRANFLCLAVAVAVVLGAYVAFKYSLAIRVDTAREAAGVIVAEYQPEIDVSEMQWSVEEPAQQHATHALTGSRDGKPVARVELAEMPFGWEQVAYSKLNETFTAEETISHVSDNSGTLLGSIVLLLPLINLVLAVVATVRCVRTGQRDVVLILWLLFVWLLPVIGPVVALCVVRRPPSAVL